MKITGKIMESKGGENQANMILEKANGKGISSKRGVYHLLRQKNKRSQTEHVMTFVNVEIT